jgi:two-component system, cell cycle sensor histidine kinase PleC
MRETMSEATSIGSGERLYGLTATSRALSDETPLDELLEITAETAESLLGAESVVLLVQDREHALEIRAARGLSDEALKRFDLSMDEALFERLSSLLDAPRRPAPFIGVPLVARGKVVGLLVVHLPRERPDERDEWILSALADQASAALEHALQQAARVDLAAQLDELRARGRLQEHALQVVQHDLRTPLGAIRGYLDLLEHGAYGPLAPRQSRALQRIGVAVEHLETLVEEALEMSRVLAGDVSVTCEPVQLGPLIEQAMGMVELDARDAHITLRRRGGDDLRVLADEGRLRQVLVHLLDNAIRHGGENAEVRIDCVPDEGSESVSVRISDDGPGVAPELADEIFEPYKSFGGRGGSGLGLAIARGVTALMGGEIGRERTGSGATFFVRLPRA